MKFFRTFASRYIRFFMLGLVALVVLESAGLLWLDKIYFRSDSHIAVSTLDSSVFSKAKGQTANLPGGASDIQYSYDGGYVSYMLGGKLTVVDMAKNTQAAVPDVGGESMKIDAYAWVYGRNRIILAEHSTGSTSKNYIRFYYYVPSDTSEVQEVGDASSNQRVSIDLSRLKNLNSASASVSDLVISTAYSSIYAKIQDKNGRSVIYMLDIDNNLNLVDTSADYIGKMLAYQQDNGLLYEDSKTGYVYSWQPTKKSSASKVINAGGTKKLRLLGVDGEDNLYLAPTSGDTASAVLVGTAAGGWRTVSLGKETDLSRIAVSLAGKIYVNDPSAGVLRNLTDSTQTEYAGTLAGIFNDGFFAGRSAAVSASSSGRGGASSRQSASSSSVSGVAGQTLLTDYDFGTDPASGSVSGSGAQASSGVSSKK